MEKRTTIVDVARKAGVSVATCSRVLSGSDYPVKTSTRESIVNAARELDYRPNPFSRMLKGKQNSHIGVIVPSITNPFYSEILSSIQEASLRAGFIPIICSSSNKPELEQKFIEMFSEEQVAGIMMSCINWKPELVKLLDDSHIPFVLFDQVDEAYSGDYVGFNFYQAGRMAVEYLAELGHTSLAFASGPIERISRKQYSSGFTYEAEERKLKHRLIIENDEGDYLTGMKIGRKIIALEQLPSAIVAVNDLTAMGIMKVLLDNSISIPSDISILGFDDIPYSAMLNPALTTIRQSATRTGSEAARILIDKIRGRSGDTVRIVFRPEMVERQTVRRKYIRRKYDN